jgi:hypothetical protein
MYTVEKLKANTLDERAQIYKNCLRNGGAKAEAVIEMLKATGLPYQKDRSLSHGDPIYRAMEIVINNPENVDKMLDAAAKGRPPLEAVDPLIKAKLGKDYGSHNEGTVTAGYLVGQKMYALNFEKTGEFPLIGCVAKTAATFRKRKAS